MVSIECKRFNAFPNKSKKFVSKIGIDSNSKGKNCLFMEDLMKGKTKLRKNSIETEFVIKITSLFPVQITKVIFFGSRAKGLSKPGSDYDFLIVLKEKDRKVVEELYDVVTDFLIRDGVDISLKIYKEKEFQDMISIPTPFMASILKTGKELWGQKTKP